MGKPVDMGALLLRNENIRAAGNMNVNARGDRLDSNNRVTETRSRQAQRRYDRQSNVAAGPAHTGTGAIQTPTESDVEQDIIDTVLQLDPISESADPVDATPPNVPTEESDNNFRGGLAAAIARSKEVKQELIKTPRQILQSQGVSRI